jgi:hypothetical protein
VLAAGAVYLVSVAIRRFRMRMQSAAAA